jgi:ABC-type antimicrobial peptide transport system permease subunit
MSLTMRTGLTAPEVARLLQQVSAGLSAQLAISDVRPMAAVLADAVAAPAATTSLLVTMAGLALVLGCVGVFGVLSFLVSRQSRDLGIRLALGAQRRDVFWLVIRDGALLCLSGVGLGIMGALGTAHWMASELYRRQPDGPGDLRGGSGCGFAHHARRVLRADTPRDEGRSADRPAGRVRSARAMATPLPAMRGTITS